MSALILVGAFAFAPVASFFGCYYGAQHLWRWQDRRDASRPQEQR